MKELLLVTGGVMIQLVLAIWGVATLPIQLMDRLLKIAAMAIAQRIVKIAIERETNRILKNNKVKF